MRKANRVWLPVMAAAVMTAGMLGGCGQKAEETTGAARTEASAAAEAESRKAEENQETADIQQAEIPNPLVEVTGTEAFEELGIHMEAPEGAENLQYYILSETVADMRFTLNQIDYTYRASIKAEDFAGIFERFTDHVLELAAEGRSGAAQIQIKTTQSSGRLASWAWGDVKYTLYTAHEMSDEEISQVVLDTALLSEPAE